MAPALTRHACLCGALGFTALAFIAQPARAAVTGAWVHRYSNVVTNSNDQARRLVRDAAGDIIVTGTTEDGINTDIMTVKYSGANGSVLWQKRYNGPNAIPTALAVDPSGNVVVTGYSGNRTNNYHDYYTAKYAAVDGALLWEKHYNGSPNSTDVAQAVAVDDSGNVVVTRFSRVSDFNHDYYTAKYAASDGTMLWEKRYNGPADSDDKARAVAVDAGDNVVVTGGSERDSYTVKYAAVDGAMSGSNATKAQRTVITSRRRWRWTAAATWS